MHCHADRDFTKFSGPVIAGTEGKGGEEASKGVFVKNITPSVLGNWTDDEIARAITAGITKEGDTLFQVMPYRDYIKMPTEDINSIVAYLRTLRPIPDSVPKRHLDAYPGGFITASYNSLMVKHAGEKIPLPAPGDRVKMGAYLVNAANCNGCHTPFDNKKMEFKRDAYLSGGVLFDKSQFKFKVTSANITPDTATGIGGWTEDMFLAKFKNYRDPKSYSYDPAKNNSIMPWTVLCNITDEDLKDMYAYLRTVKPVNRKVEKWPQ
jgi:Cytochrome c